MPFDFKKEYKELYQPKSKPQITAVPPMNYIAVRGTGDPNEDGGAYQQAISVLYAVAVQTAAKKKQLDCSSAEFLTIEEGLCVQIMHVGSYDDEPASVAVMDEYLAQNGYANDLTAERLHHEIYLSDPRKTAPEKRKTVLRHPIKKA